MSKRYQGGVLGVGFNPLQAPNAPTAVTATGGDTSASVAFTAPANVGGSAITGYTVQSNPGAVAATGSASPITVSGLTNGTAYTFNVWALNSYGPSPAGGPSGAVTPALQRGLFGGGTSYSNQIQYLNIATTGNTINFGSISYAGVEDLAACASSTRGIFAGGANPSPVQNIAFVTIATTGNTTSFGSLVDVNNAFTGLSNETRGVFCGGNTSTGTVDTMQYITIASTGNATNFGTLTIFNYFMGTCASPTRGIIAGGWSGPGGANGVTNSISFITIASTGNASGFGMLTVARGSDPAGCSSSTRGLFGGGYLSNGSPTSVIDYITIASTGNAISFGSLTVARFLAASCCSTTRAVWGGGLAGSNTNVMDYVTIATTGNAVDFGDLTTARSRLAGLSNAHGGL
jgi:hypothetical protein